MWARAKRRPRGKGGDPFAEASRLSFCARARGQAGLIAERALALGSEHEDEELERAAAGVLGAVYARLGDDERALRYSEQVGPRRAMPTVSVVKM